MMLEFGNCPQCKLDISAERKAIQPMICNHCGYTSSNDQKVTDQIEKKNIIAFVALSLFVVGSHIQLMNWDSHSLNIIPIAIKQTLGMGSQADAEAK